MRERPMTDQHTEVAPSRIIVADDDDGLRTLLRELLGLLPHVTLVGEAADGIEAVRLVAQHYPDTALLDINMPRLDGFGAAEVIQSFRPQTKLILHTASPDDEKRRRADLLGLPLLDKLRIPSTMDLVEEYAVAGNHSVARDIEPLVLLALAGRADEGVIVVKADETIPFYNPAVAAALNLPFPPTPLTLADVRERDLALRGDGTAYPVDEQPLVRALTEARPVADAVYLRDAEGNARPYLMSSLPFFAPDGALIGVANYVTAADG
jgi:CheY-like chemotaxis protein